MAIGPDVVRGVVRIDTLPEGKCFTGWADFLRQLPGLLSVEIPVGITNVTLGNLTPSDSERDHLWIKTDGSGSFLGLFIYAAGGWKQVYPVPQQLFLVYGDSRDIPEGYTLASDDPNISPTMLASLQKIWSIGGTSPAWWSVFHVTYTGF